MVMNVFFFSPIISSSPQGFSTPLHHQYVGEISPRKLRGFANSTASFFWSLGKAIGQIAGQRYSTTDLRPSSYLDPSIFCFFCCFSIHLFLFSKTNAMNFYSTHTCFIPARELLGSQSRWPMLMASCGIPALVQLFTLPFFPESPPYLLMHKEDQEGCRKGNWVLCVPVPYLAFSWFVSFLSQCRKKFLPAHFWDDSEYPLSTFLL